MDHLDKEVIESLSEPAKRVFKSLDYRSKQRMLKKAREMAKTEKMKRRKKSRFKKKGIEKWNKDKKQADNIRICGDSYGGIKYSLYNKSNRYRSDL